MLVPEMIRTRDSAAPTKWSAYDSATIQKSLPGIRGTHASIHKEAALIPNIEETWKMKMCHDNIAR